jgi:hypothetical protein
MEYPSQDTSNFYSDIVKLFGKYRLDEKVLREEVTEDYCLRRRKIITKSYQKIIPEYMSKATDYRGILGFYGLGSGKTRIAVLTMNSIDKDTIIMLPASLRANFKSEILRTYKGKRRYSFLSYNAPNLVAQYERLNRDFAIKPYINNFDNKFIIIDESHIFFQNVISGKAKQAIKIFNLMMKAKGMRILLLTGTPISGDPFELVPMFNLLRGYMYKDNKRYELFPSDRSIFNKHFISHEHNSLKNKEIFKERLSGLVSYYKGLKDPMQYIVPKNLGIILVRSEMGGSQWDSYLKVRKREADIERIFKYKTEAFTEAVYKKPERAAVGTYKVNSSMACNFTFPSKVNKLFDAIIDFLPSKKGNINWVAVKERFSKVANITFPRKLEVAEIKWRIMMTMKSEVKEVIKNIHMYSGKMATLIDMLMKSKKRKKFVFSNFKVLGIRVIAFLLENNGYKRIQTLDDFKRSNDYKGFVLIDGDTKNKEDLRDWFNDKDNVYGEKISILLGTKVVSAGVNFHHVRETHILEPQWRDITIEQVIGRSIRICSHKLLPRKDRNVQVYIHICTPMKGTRSLLPKDDGGKSTDEILYDLANVKSEFVDTFLHAMKESAIDCDLNLFFNQSGGKKIVCMSCKSEEKIKIFPVDWREHIVSGPRCVTKEMYVQLFPLKQYVIDKNIEGVQQKIAKRYESFKMDMNNVLFEFVDNIWTEVGFIRDDEIILYEENID